MSRGLTADEAAVLAAGGELKKGNSGAGDLPENQMGAEGGLAAKAPGDPMVKGEEEGEENEEENEEEDGEEMEKKVKKSEVNENDLIKSMNALEAIASGISGDPDRRAELAEKLANGTLEKGERSELMALIGEEDSEGEEDFEKSLSEAWAEPDQLGDDYDVTPFLEKLGTNIAGALDLVRTDLNKSMQNQQSFNRALAKSFKGVAKVVVEQADMIKSLQSQNDALASRLGIVERQPAGRKAVSSNAKPLKKSFGGVEEGALSRDDILEGLEQLMVKSQTNDWRAPCGEPIDRAMAQYEATGHISRSMLEDVKNVLGAPTN
jgi:hypothetical protein